MARERWFYAEGHRRMGPVARRELVDALLQLTDPRSCLIWRRGLQAWTPASSVPEIDGLLAPVLRAETPSRAETPRPEAPAAEPPRPAPTPTVRPQPTRAGGRAPLYAALGIGAVLVGALAWWWSRAPVPGPPVADSPDADVAGAPTTPPTVEATPAADGADGAAAVAAATAPEAEAAGTRPATGGIDREADLPPDQLQRLRGVGGWAGETLTITLYNGSAWRVTEIYVLMSRMEGDRFVDAPLPQLLLPVGTPVEGAVQDLLKKVAPERKRAGVNPEDTGPFEATLGPRPAAFRWKIERARGYPPR
jgi:hypothetical protein